MTWCFSPCLHLLHLPLPWLPFSLPLLLLPPFSYLCTTPSSLTSCFVLFLILSFLLLFLSPLSTPFFYLLCHPLWVVWLLFCCLLISRPDPSFPARSFLFFTSSFFHPVVCFLLLYCFTNQVYRVLRSAGIRMWFTVRLSLCLLGFFLISVFPHTAQGQGKYHCYPAVHSRINNPSSPHWAQAELFIHSPAGLTMKFPNDTPQGKPELSDRVLNCQDLHMYRFSPV